MNTIRTTEQSAAAVAAYASLEGAERAVAHLVSLGYDEHDLGIGPRDFKVVDQHPMSQLVSQSLRWGLTVGVAAMTVIALARELGTETLVESVLPLIAWGAAGGVVVGAVIALIAHRRYRTRSFGTPPEAIAPTRFEVVVDRDRDMASHGLAKWWDPAAPPAGWQQSA